MFRRFKIKLLNWEYWPIWLVYAPVSFYYLYLAVRARSLCFFSASNPSIENGGMFFESKWNITQLLPQQFCPKTIFIQNPDSFNEVLSRIREGGMTYPFIAKPDVGGRGNAVQLIQTEQQLMEYNRRVRVAYLIQEYSTYNVEVSLFYQRLPGNHCGKITSFTYKELLTVTGDGISNIEDLIKDYDRAYLQWEKLKNNTSMNFAEILRKGEKRVIVPYGNHCLGAKFINYNHLINAQLERTFDDLSGKIKGFYFGRYDIRCNSIRDLMDGRNFHILELNGAGAEPAHIYHPGYSFFKAQKDLAMYYKSMYLIAKENNKMGQQYLSFREYREQRRLEKLYKSKISFAC